MTGNTHVDNVLLIAALVAALGVISRAAWRSFVIANNVYTLLKEIHYEITPNGGDSVHDIIERADTNHKIAHRNIETVYGVVLKFHDIDPTEAPLLEVLETKESQRRRREENSAS